MTAAASEATGVEVFESPAGGYVVRADAWEVLASQWVYHPSVRTADGTLVWSPIDRHWSLERALWVSETRVDLVLRKYPGNQRRPVVEVGVDCRQRLAFIDGASCDLDEAEHALLAALFASAQAG